MDSESGALERDLVGEEEEEEEEEVAEVVMFEKTEVVTATEDAEVADEAAENEE